MPAHIELPRQPRGRTHRLFAAFAGADAHQQRAFGVPHAADGFFNPIAAHVILNVFRRAAQRNFAQRNQVTFAKKVLCSALGLLRQVHLARFEPSEQFIRRHVHQNDFIGIVQHRVGHGLVYPHTGDRTHRAIQAFKVLHIEC